MYNIWTLGRTRHPTAILQAKVTSAYAKALCWEWSVRKLWNARDKGPQASCQLRGQAEEERVQRRECEGRRSLVRSLAALFAHHYWWLPRRVKRQSETVHSTVFLAYSRHSDSRTRRSDCGELVKTYPGKTTGKKEERLDLLIFCPRLRTPGTGGYGLLSFHNKDYHTKSIVVPHDCYGRGWE